MSDKYEEMARRALLANEGQTLFHHVAIVRDALRFADEERAKETCEMCAKKPSCGYLALLKDTMDSPSAGEGWGYDKFGCIHYRRRLEEVKG